jgi:hypothetical protein
MPARRLSDEASAIKRFDVLGIDAENSREFVRHVGLAKQESQHVKFGSKPEMYDMGPPLGSASSPDPIASVGSAPLSDDEIFLVNSFVENIEGEYEAQRMRDNALVTIREPL